MKDFYSLYPHIMPGSIERVPEGTRIQCGKDDEIISHGTICVIKCATDGAIPGCRKTRVINLQDAKQVKQCRHCLRYLSNLRRRQKRSR